MTSRRLRKCPECGERKLERLVGSGAGIIFKGSGFYETDYKRAGTRSGKGGKPSSSSSSSSAGEGTASEGSSSKDATASKSKATKDSGGDAGTGAE